MRSRAGELSGFVVLMVCAVLAWPPAIGVPPRGAVAGAADAKPAVLDVLETRMAHCSWSFFGDPRALVHGTTVLTGCIGVDGTPLLVRADSRTGAWSQVRLFGRMEVDDHNNPSLVLWRGRLWAFASPHSGHQFPLDRRMYVHYRASLEAYGIRGGFGPVRGVPLARGCGLGYTYPNPVVWGDRLYLFLRGPCLQPIFTSTRDGRHWAAARTLVLGAPRAGGPHRPYAKYAGAAGGISMTFSDGHPYSHATSLFYMRMRGGRFYRADGSLIGDTGDLPFPIARLDHVYDIGPGTGNAWPLDIAVDADGVASIIYVRNSGGDGYWYARWTAGGWINRRIADVGSPYGSYTTAGASLCQEDPSWVAVAGNPGGGACNEVKLMHTADGGATWQIVPVTGSSVLQNFRPVFPRGVQPAGRLLLEWISGTAPSFRHFNTVLILQSRRQPPRS